MPLGLTLQETHHGNPGERRILPAGIVVHLEPADNLPDDSPIKWWAHPANRGDKSLYSPARIKWPADIEQWAQDVGVGLRADDVREIKSFDDLCMALGAI